MKTIESILKHAEQIGKEPGKPQDQRMINNIKIGMRVAIAECQRWIPVDDELPACSDEDILLKGIDDRGVEGIVDIGYMHDTPNGKPHINGFVSLGGVLVKVTHWRLIELK